MSKKLLEEQAVRKFMKIAGLQPLTNSFLRENDGKVKVEESKEELDEVEDLEEGGGQMPFDAQDRRADDRAPMEEGKGAPSPAKMKGAPASMKMKPASASSKNSAKALKEEEMPDGMDDVEMSPEDMEDDMEAPAADGGLDIEALVKDLIGVITARIPGASDVVSVESEGDETEVEMDGDESEPELEAGEGEEEMEGGDEDALDEVALTNIVAETVKRVKARLKEGKAKSNAVLDKNALAKKVAARVVQQLKRT
jgi:hypothetical protein